MSEPQARRVQGDFQVTAITPSASTATPHPGLLPLPDPPASARRSCCVWTVAGADAHSRQDEPAAPGRGRDSWCQGAAGEACTHSVLHPGHGMPVATHGNSGKTKQSSTINSLPAPALLSLNPTAISEAWRRLKQKPPDARKMALVKVELISENQSKEKY